jgi:putative addiction module component (TIGR02574 family)
MATTPKDLYEMAMSLNDEERAELIGLLLESLEIGGEDGVATAWLKEIERRVAEIDSAAVETESWSEVRSRVFETRDP